VSRLPTISDVVSTAESRSGHLPAVATLVAGFILTSFFAAFVRDWEIRKQREQVAQVSAEHVEALRGELIRSIEVLYAIEALISTRRDISRQEFRDFVANTLSRRPEIQGLAWDPRVPSTARKQWEARARRDGFDAFQIVEQARDGRVIPAGERPEYFPVLYMENLSANEAALGFDLLSEQKRRSAVERARDTGYAAATPPIRLVQETGSQLGFLVLLPIYDRPVSSLEDRRATLRGFAVAVYRIGDLMDASLRSALAKGLGVTITDAESGQPIYGHPPDAPSGSSWDTAIDVAGRRWTLHFEPSPKFNSSTLRWHVGSSLAVGAIISILLSAYFWSVRDRTVRLAASNNALLAEIATRKQAEARAEAANRSKSAFLANMSHEIRTPLNAILGFAQILLRCDALGAFQREAVRTIAGSSAHLLHVINEILDLSKIDSGRMEVVHEEFDVRALVLDIAAMFQPLCEEKHLALRVEGTDALQCHLVVGDGRRLRQVLINLLGNAVKFTDTGVVTLRVHDRRDGRWRFDVEDTGPGIPREMRHDVFEPFQQGRGGCDRGGTGLGLSIARRHAELMGGALVLEPREGPGSLFHVTLLLPAASGASASSGAPIDVVRLASGQTVRALVVDDLPENRTVLSTMLCMAGCDTVVAADGEQAIEAARGLGPDIVFMDLRLRGQDGLDATRRIITELSPRRVRIVAMSASVLDGERERCLAAGCDAFVAKPFHVGQIYACVASLLNVRFEAHRPPDAPVDPATAETPHGEPPILPEDLVSRLNRAAELQSATSLRGCLGELDGLGPNGRHLAERLRALLANCDMEAIQRTVEHLPMSSGAA
jgi:signal transduction histidine kinase/DNA-binding NarL/FixJ family response regulator/sensor domain CHASE-containing protein